MLAEASRTGISVACLSFHFLTNRRPKSNRLKSRHQLSLTDLPVAKSLRSLGKKVTCLAQGTGRSKVVAGRRQRGGWGVVKRTCWITVKLSLLNRLTKYMFNSCILHICLVGSENSSYFLHIAFTELARSLKCVVGQINTGLFFSLNGRKHTIFLSLFGNDVLPWMKKISKHPPTY